jgi:ATP-dependent 26S proteasome regulatory subunit
LSGRPHDKNIDFDRLTVLTDGYSSADIIEGIVEGAARLAANLDKQSIDQELLEDEIGKLKPVEEVHTQIGF